jgi:hypothetical protein
MMTTSMVVWAYVALAICSKLKLQENLCWYLQWFDFIRLPSEKYKIVSCRKKYFEEFKDFLISFRLYFVAMANPLLTEKLRLRSIKPCRFFSRFSFRVALCPLS